MNEGAIDFHVSFWLLLFQIELEKIVTHRNSISERLSQPVTSLDDLNNAFALLQELGDMENTIDDVYLPVENIYADLRYHISFHYPLTLEELVRFVGFDFRGDSFHFYYISPVNDQCQHVGCDQTRVRPEQVDFSHRRGSVIIYYVSPRNDYISVWILTRVSSLFSIASLQFADAIEVEN